MTNSFTSLVHDYSKDWKLLQFITFSSTNNEDNSYTVVVIKYYVGICISILSILCIGYILYLCEMQHHSIMLFDTIVDNDEDDETNEQRRKKNQSRLQNSDSTTNHQNEIGYDTRLEIEEDGTTTMKVQDEHAILPSMRSNNKQKQQQTQQQENDLYRFRTLLPTQYVSLMGQVMILVLFNYLLLVKLPSSDSSNGWKFFLLFVVSLFGTICVVYITIRYHIVNEIRIAKYDRLVHLGTCYLYLTFGFILWVTCSNTIYHTQLYNHNLYHGLAHIITVNSSSTTNSLNGDNSMTVVAQSTLQVSWGGSWGCPNYVGSSTNKKNVQDSSNGQQQQQQQQQQHRFCSAPLDGVTCQTQQQQNMVGGYSYQTTTSKYNDADNYDYYYSYNEEENYNNNNNNGNYEEDYYHNENNNPMNDDVESVILMDDANEVDVRDIYNETTHEIDEEDIEIIYNHGQDAIEIIKDMEPKDTNNATTVEVVYGEFHNNNNSTTLAPGALFSTTTNTTEDVYEEHDFHDTTPSSTTTTHGGGGGNNRRKNRSMIRRFLVDTTTTEEDDTTMVEEKVQEELAVSEEMITEEVSEFQENLYDTAIEDVDEDYEDYINESTIDKDIIEKYETNNTILTNANVLLQQKMNVLQQQLQYNTQQDEILIQNEIQMNIQLNHQDVLDNINTNDSTQPSRDQDPFMMSTTYDDDTMMNEFGNYACQSLYNFQNYYNMFYQNDDDDVHGNKTLYLNPNVPPPPTTTGGEDGTTTTTTATTWPTIEIYGNCATCTAYLVDEYSTQYYEKDMKQDTSTLFLFYFVGILLSTMVCIIIQYKKYQKEKVQRTQSNSSSSYDTPLFHDNNNNNQQQQQQPNNKSKKNHPVQGGHNSSSSSSSSGVIA